MSKTNKALRNTIAIIIILAVSVGLGFAYERIAKSLEKSAHPLLYEDFVVKYSGEYNVPQELIYAVIKAESGFKIDAVSHAGAIGLMQIMPTTFEDMSNRLGEETVEGLLYDPETNIKYGTYYLRYLYDMFKEWDLAVAAYNGGLGNVNKWRENPEYIKDDKIVYIPVEETRNYVKRVNKNKEVYKRLYFSEGN